MFLLHCTSVLLTFATRGITKKVNILILITSTSVTYIMIWQQSTKTKMASFNPAANNYHICTLVGDDIQARLFSCIHRHHFIIINCFGKMILRPLYRKHCQNNHFFLKNEPIKTLFFSIVAWQTTCSCWSQFFWRWILLRPVGFCHFVAYFLVSLLANIRVNNFFTIVVIPLSDQMRWSYYGGCSFGGPFPRTTGL